MSYKAEDPKNITYKPFDEKKTTRVSPEAVIKQLQDTIQQLVNEDILATIIKDDNSIIIQSITIDKFTIDVLE